MRSLSIGLVPLILLASAPPPVSFQDLAPRAGLHFVLHNSATPFKHQIETMVSGVAVFDFNSDGRPDLYFVNGALQPKLVKSDPSFFNRLYRNDGNWKFTDVTLAAGVPGEGFATGVAAADYDNDGFTDLFIAGVNRDILYRNRGDGTFEDATSKAGLVPKGRKPWAISAGFFDYDQDGFLDLFVTNYVIWDPAREPFCGDPFRSYRTYCHPQHYTGLPNQLFRNNRDGTFTDVSVAAGITPHVGKGMSTLFADYDQDGLIDVLVTNDTTPNFLFRNLGNGRFRETALQAGVAFNQDGRAVSSMGADFRDLDNDGLPDLLIVALANETFPLFRNLGKGQFVDVTYPSGLGRLTLPHSGWSNGIFDFNNDGFKDLFIACGDVNDNTELFSSRRSRQRNLVLLNAGDGKFIDWSAQAGADFQQTGLHRGAAFGDFDLDGRVDVVVSRIGERAELFRNTSSATAPLRRIGGRLGQSAPHWLAVRLTGRRSNRDAIGARIRLVSSSGRQQFNHVTTSTGYACASDKTVFFGLGQDSTVKLLEITWPSGAVQKLEDVPADVYLTLAEP